MALKREVVETCVGVLLELRSMPRRDKSHEAGKSSPGGRLLVAGIARAGGSWLLRESEREWFWFLLDLNVWVVIS